MFCWCTGKSKVEKTEIFKLKRIYASNLCNITIKLHSKNIIICAFMWYGVYGTVKWFLVCFALCSQTRIGIFYDFSNANDF